MVNVRSAAEKSFKGTPYKAAARPRDAEPIKLALPGGAILYRTTLALPKDLPLESWQSIGACLTNLSEGLQWAIGDWWSFGFHRYGERKAKAAKRLPYELGTLMNLGYVARRVPTSLRNEALSWSHHYAVAALSADKQKKCLDLAASRQWSVRELQRYISDERREQIERGLVPNPVDDPQRWYRKCEEEAQRALGLFVLGCPPIGGWLDDLNEPAVQSLIGKARGVARAWEHFADEIETYRSAMPRTPRVKVRDL